MSFLKVEVSWLIWNLTQLMVESTRQLTQADWSPNIMNLFFGLVDRFEINWLIEKIDQLRQNQKSRKSCWWEKVVWQQWEQVNIYCIGRLMWNLVDRSVWAHQNGKGKVEELKMKACKRWRSWTNWSKCWML